MDLCFFKVQNAMRKSVWIDSSDFFYIVLRQKKVKTIVRKNFERNNFYKCYL